MGKKLIIAEKPSLSNTIQRALYNERWQRFSGYSEGEEYICTNCFGHLFQLYDLDDYFNRGKQLWSLEEIPFIPNVYKYKVKDDPGIKKQLAIIEDLIKRNDVDSIIHAGDADSEGCKLVNQVIEYCFTKNNIIKPVKRLWFKDQSEKSIRIDINNLRENKDFDNYDNEATARARIDYIIGINYSRGITLISSASNKEAGINSIKLPQGRILGTIVEYIYQRYKEQESFIPQKYFNLGLNVEGAFSVILKNSIFKEEEQITALSVLNELNKSNTYVSKIEKINKNKYANNLFSLTTLQNTINKKYKIRNKAVLSAAQNLYEKGYITYPRTSSEYLASNSKDTVKEIITVYKEIYTNIDFKDTLHLFDDSKVDSHEAIIPTTKIPTEELLNDEKIVYEVIRNRFLANFCTDECIVEYKTITIANSINDYIAQINGIKVIKKGFLVFENIIEDKILPDYKEGEKINGVYVINECYTQAPKNVSAIELNNFLESPLSKENESIDEKYEKLLGGLEIGTVATRADIIENAIKYGYIEEKDGIYKITNKGIYFIETSKKLGLVMGVEHNVQIGKYLKAVFNNKITVDQCLESIEKFVTKSVAKAKTIKVDPFVVEKEILGKCPVCQKNVFESPKSFYCEGVKDKSCNFFIQKNDKFISSRGKSVTSNMMKVLLSKGIAKVTNLSKVDGSSKYDAYIKIVKNGNYYNLKFATKEEIPENKLLKCPRCGNEIFESDKSFYCSSYRDEKNKCSYTLWKYNKYLEERNIKLTKANYKSLIEGKKILIKNIERKDKKGFYNANLYIEDTGIYVNYKLDIVKGE